MIPETIDLSGTIRSYGEEARNRLSKELERAFALARALGGDYQLNIEPGLPSLYNDPQVAKLIRQVALDMLGDGNLHPHQPGNWSEDFSYMAREAPGAMVVLGVHSGAEYRPHHSPIFDLDESALPVGAAVLAETACRLLKNGGK